MHNMICVLLLVLASVVEATDRVPVFPYGGVYFHKSNPPREDWETDYRTAAEPSVNIMRYWFMWVVTEVAPGKYDWSDYDQQIDLAARNGIKVIISEISNSAPEWMGELYPDGRTVSGNNSVSSASMSASNGIGEFGEFRGHFT